MGIDARLLLASLAPLLTFSAMFFLLVVMSYVELMSTCRSCRTVAHGLSSLFAPRMALKWPPYTPQPLDTSRMPPQAAYNPR